MPECTPYIPENHELEGSLRSFREMQSARTTDGHIFIPASFGTLITNDSCDVFTKAVLGTLSYIRNGSKVYALPGLVDKASGADTANIYLCGVVTMNTKSFRLLAHDMGPEGVSALFAKALHLARSKGISVNSAYQVTLYNNPDTAPYWASGDIGYKAEIGRMLTRLGLDYTIIQQSVTGKTLVSI